MEMPIVNLDKVLPNLSEEEKKVALLCLNNGRVRATKPRIDKNDPLTGKAVYVWRMVVFLVSHKHAHHCIPMGADFDLPIYPWKEDAARVMRQELKRIEDAIVDSIPKENWYGVKRWSNAGF